MSKLDSNMSRSKALSKTMINLDWAMSSDLKGVMTMLGMSQSWKCKSM